MREKSQRSKPTHRFVLLRKTLFFQKSCLDKVPDLKKIENFYALLAVTPP